MNEVLLRLAIGLVLSAIIGYLGYRRAALTRSGWLGAIITGTAIFGFGGLDGGLLLIAFFVSSSLLTRYKATLKTDVANSFAKSGRRDLGQALANGGVASLAAIVFGLTSSPIALAALVGALAEANADTWATELGVLSRHQPRLITTGRAVERGTSGGITLEGTLAALVGAGLIGGLASVFWSNGSLLLIAIVAGVIGSLFDSLLGAAVQGIYYSESRCQETEKAIEANGTRNRLIRGLHWIDNDLVNFLATFVGAVMAGLMNR